MKARTRSDDRMSQGGRPAGGDERAHVLVSRIEDLGRVLAPNGQRPLHLRPRPVLHRVTLGAQRMMRI